MATPKLYDGIRLLYAEPGEQFPEEFDPKCPWAIRNYTEMDRECFVDMFKWKNSRAVVPLEDFENDPRALWEVPVMDVELREGATYIVVPLKETTSGKKDERKTSWRYIHPDEGAERKLEAQAVKHLVDNGEVMSTPKLYRGITLFFAEPGEPFPGYFDPAFPWDMSRFKMMSREGFVDRVKGENSIAVVPLEDFEKDPGAPCKTPEDIELRDGATYIVVELIEEEEEEEIKNGRLCDAGDRTEGVDRRLEARAVKYLVDSGETNVRPLGLKELTGPGGLSKQLSAGAIGDNCAVVVEHRSLMTRHGAVKLAELLSFINENKDRGKGSVSQLSGKRIIGVFAGPAEDSDADGRRDMDYILQAKDCLKWFEPAEEDKDTSSGFEAPGDSGDFSASTDGNDLGNGSNIPSALPRRVKPQAGLPNRMRCPAMLVRPRFVNKAAAGFRVSF